MGFFDRFFGKKKEEPPRTPAPAYVPPEPPPLPVTPSPRLEPEVAPSPPAGERRVEAQPLVGPAISEPVAEVPVPVVAEEAMTNLPSAAPADEAALAEEELAEEDFSISALTGQPATDERDLGRPSAEVAHEAPAAEVEEVLAGVGTRLEATSTGARGLELTDAPSTLDEDVVEAADFDLPQAPSQTSADGSLAVSQLDGQETFPTVGEDEDDLEGFDDAFDRLLAQDELDGFGEDAEPAVTTDQTEVRTLFSEIAANYIRPVKAFIIELRAGAARKEWLEMCQPAISSLGKSALGMGMEDVSDAVHDFEALLSEARASREGTVGGELRERILQNYDMLTEMLPATFVIDDTTLQSEGMIVNSLLKQIPEVGKVTIDKLYRAGLITIESFLVGAKEDLAVATGLPIWLAEKIVEKFKSYQQQLESGLVQSGKEGLLNKLEQLVRDLQDAHEAYEVATAEESSNPSAAEDRRFYRQARQETQLQINVLLAELGAVELANEIQRLSFEKRVERLRRYITDERRS